MQDLKSWNKLGIGELIRMYMHEAWYFEKWYEKAIMVGLGMLGMWKIAGWIF